MQTYIVTITNDNDDTEQHTFNLFNDAFDYAAMRAHNAQLNGTIKHITVEAPIDGRPKNTAAYKVTYENGTQHWHLIN